MRNSPLGSSDTLAHRRGRRRCACLRRSSRHALDNVDVRLAHAFPQVERDLPAREHPRVRRRERDAWVLSGRAACAVAPSRREMAWLSSGCDEPLKSLQLKLPDAGMAAASEGQTGSDAPRGRKRPDDVARAAVHSTPDGADPHRCKRSRRGVKRDQVANSELTPSHRREALRDASEAAHIALHSRSPLRRKGRPDGAHCRSQRRRHDDAVVVVAELVHA